MELLLAMFLSKAASRAPIYIPKDLQTCSWTEVGSSFKREVLGNVDFWVKHRLVDILSPGGLSVLTLQQSVELFKLLHCLVFQVGVGNLQPNAVCRPGELAGEHLC